jgi:hypothetical protein
MESRLRINIECQHLDKIKLQLGIVDHLKWKRVQGMAISKWGFHSKVSK